VKARLGPQEPGVLAVFDSLVEQYKASTDVQARHAEFAATIHARLDFLATLNDSACSLTFITRFKCWF